MSDLAQPRHRSVLPAEVSAWLDPRPGEIWVDATVGAGGHTRELALRVAPNGRVVGLDRDAQMLDLARRRLAQLPVTLVHGSFDQLPAVLAELGIPAVDGVLADLGFCSDQMDDAGRGMSFHHDGPLDMRLDRSSGATAAELLARLSERDLADLIWQYGEERYSRRVAKRIVQTRDMMPITTTRQLAELVRACVPRGRERIDPATRTFQALRIAVNDELAVLEIFLAGLPRLVKPGGRVGIISFHSLEDRLVKRAFRDATVWEVRTKKPLVPSDDEMRDNPRSRSAKLRVAARRG
jgi:16S rRNA (cytosine1402-N4)-methyltransferase